MLVHKLNQALLLIYFGIWENDNVLTHLLGRQKVSQELLGYSFSTYFGQQESNL